ncbi:cupin domain-containing protein [Ramlibacter sp.]|uniref:cupin domain-containing protein n=1 Tax=Ramlibacter sp. TaxID=1917967 RepID=UPI001851F86D|nr:cupin domain-containing protein [Ramlibacter sp.]MBA2672693.1 cupin domain-containing protein [Ramlibacter sp.]
MISTGQAVSYTRYRDAFAGGAGNAVHWNWSAILEALSAATPGERGSLTLSKTGQASECELMPGMAVTIQVVPGESRTRPHAHSWWHLFVVCSGSAQALLGALGDAEARQLHAKDLLLVPAWTRHHFENGGQEDLVLLSMSNLPQQSGLANHRADEP